MTLYPIVLAVSLVAALQGASFPNALLNFVNSETSLDTLKEIYLSKKAYLALHESIPAKMTFGGALLLLFGMLVFNRIVFFFANRPLRRAKKSAKKAKKNQ